MGRVDKAAKIHGSLQQYAAAAQPSRHSRVLLDLLQVVKVRGFRVDLDGLEASLAKCPHVTAPSINDVPHSNSSSVHAQGMLNSFSPEFTCIAGLWVMFSSPGPGKASGLLLLAF